MAKRGGWRTTRSSGTRADGPPARAEGEDTMRTTPMMTITTWGRWGSVPALGTIRVRVPTDGRTRAEGVRDALARRTHRTVITWRQDGRRPYSEAHYQATLGRPCHGGGWIPDAEVWCAIPIERD